jgi:hypothetical protein
MGANIEKSVGEAIKIIAHETPLVLVILGVVVVVVGAAGGVPFTQLIIAQIEWRIGLAILGVAVAAGGGLLLYSGQTGKRAKPTKCNFKITNVEHNGAVQLRESDTRKNKNYYDLHGRYDKKPPDGYSVAIIEFDPGTDTNYRLRKKAAVYDDNTWQARDIYARQSGIRLEIAVVYVSASGDALWQYYDKVRKRNGPNATPSIDHLPEDISISQRICVNTRR